MGVWATRDAWALAGVVSSIAGASDYVFGKHLHKLAAVDADKPWPWLRINGREWHRGQCYVG